MSKLNRIIAESLGYTVTKARSGYWALRLNGGGNIGNFVTENLAWDHAPDFEHDLNDAIVLFFALPHGKIGDGSPKYITWAASSDVGGYADIVDQTIEAFCHAICEAYCQFKGIAIPEE